MGERVWHQSALTHAADVAVPQPAQDEALGHLCMVWRRKGGGGKWEKVWWGGYVPAFYTGETHLDRATQGVRGRVCAWARGLGVGQLGI